MKILIKELFLPKNFVFLNKLKYNQFYLKKLKNLDKIISKNTYQLPNNIQKN